MKHVAEKVSGVTHFGMKAEERPEHGGDLHKPCAATGVMEVGTIVDC